MKKPKGRPKLHESLATKPRSIRLNEERWAKLKKLGVAWLEKKLDKEKACLQCTQSE